MWAWSGCGAGWWLLWLWWSRRELQWGSLCVGWVGVVVVASVRRRTGELWWVGGVTWYAYC